MGLSMNLTTGESHEVDPSDYAFPLVLEPEGAVFEVVFWSNKVEQWIVLVVERTGREWPPEAKMREVAESELDYYAEALAG